MCVFNLIFGVCIRFKLQRYVFEFLRLSRYLYMYEIEHDIAQAMLSSDLPFDEKITGHCH